MQYEQYAIIIHSLLGLASFLQYCALSVFPIFSCFDSSLLLSFIRALFDEACIYSLTY